MNKTQRIIERGWWVSLTAPETAPSDCDERLTQVEKALNALAPVFRPLALEVEVCWRELDTGLPSPIFPEPPMYLLVLNEAQGRVAVRPSVAAPPPPIILPQINRDTIAACLKTDISPDSNLVMDWLGIRSLAAAVHTPEPYNSIILEELGRSIPAYEPNWFAGPVGEQGFEVWPPAIINLYAEERVLLSFVVHWSGWLSQDTQERYAIETVIAVLRTSGWIAEETPLWQ